MESDLRAKQVQAWAAAYVDYKSVKKWIGDTYPYGYWCVRRERNTEPTPPTPIRPSPPSPLPPQPSHTRSSSSGGGELFPAAVAAADQRKQQSPLAIADVAIHAFEEDDSDDADESAGGSSLTTHFDITVYSSGSRAPWLQPTAVMLRCRLQSQLSCEETLFFTVRRRSAEGGLLSLTLDDEEAVLACCEMDFVEDRGATVSSAGRRRTASPSGILDDMNSSEASPQPATLIQHAASASCGFLMPPKSSTATFGRRSSTVEEGIARSKNEAIRVEAMKFSRRDLSMYVLAVAQSNYYLAKKLLVECDKVEAFYAHRSTLWTRELVRLLNSANEWHESKNGRRSSPATSSPGRASFRVVVDQLVTGIKGQQSHGQHELESLKHSLRRMYFAYVLLLNFVQQNSESVRHLVSKTEKRSQQVLSGPFEAYLRSKYLFYVHRTGGHPINALLDFIENRYIELIDGNKKKAAKVLHVEDPDSRAGQWGRIMNAAMSGTLMGLSIGFVVLTFIERDLFSDRIAITTFSTNQSVSDKILYLTGLVTLLAILFSINIVVWDHYGVNYAFIFGLDERRHWDGPKLLRMTMKYGAVWSLGLFAYSRTDTISWLHDFDDVIPIALLCVIGALAVADVLQVRRKTESFIHVLADAGKEAIVQAKNKDKGKKKKKKSKPSSGSADIASQPSWLGATLWHILTAPMYAVSFSDFYIADQLTSLTGFFGQIQSIVLQLIGNSQFNWPVLAAMPHIWRFLQCLRRWRDGPSYSVLHPNFTNALKYTSGFVQIVASWYFDSAYKAALAEQQASSTWVANGRIFDFEAVQGPLRVWILAATVEYCFKCFWDLYMDAGMFMAPSGRRTADNPHPLIRKRIMYAEYAYWAFAVFNLTCRSGTLVRIILITQNSSWSRMNSVVWWTIEVFRRFVWNFFRVENEQVSNMEKYRAVDLLPPSTTCLANAPHTTLDDVDAQFAALWKSNRSNDDLPAKSFLFDRLPLKHKRSALYALRLERRDEDAEDVWMLAHDDALRAFRQLHNEDQVRALYFAIGRESIASVLSRFPATGKDDVDVEEFCSPFFLKFGVPDAVHSEAGESLPESQVCTPPTLVVTTEEGVEIEPVAARRSTPPSASAGYPHRDALNNFTF